MGEKTNQKSPTETSQRETRNLRFPIHPRNDSWSAFSGFCRYFSLRGSIRRLAALSATSWQLSLRLTLSRQRPARATRGKRAHCSGLQVHVTPAAHFLPAARATHGTSSGQPPSAVCHLTVMSFLKVTRQPSLNATGVPRKRGALRTQYGRTSSRGYAISCKFVSRPPPSDREHTRNS